MVRRTRAINDRSDSLRSPMISSSSSRPFPFPTPHNSPEFHACLSFSLISPPLYLVPPFLSLFNCPSSSPINLFHPLYITLNWSLEGALNLPPLTYSSPMHGHCLACTRSERFSKRMGCCESEDLNVVCDSSNDGRKLPRPLIPELNANVPLTLHAQQAGVRKIQIGGEFGSQVPAQVSSRWNPTPKQLEMLEDIYRRGTRTPTTEQIQHITSQLRKFGRIEGKNVFYWFQNHKARERQKRRRKIESTDRERAQYYRFQVEQISSSLSSPIGTITAQEPISMSKSRMVSTIKSNRWDHAVSQCDNQQEGQASYKLVDLYSSSSCYEANAGVFYMPMTDQSSEQSRGSGEAIDKNCYLGEDRTLELFPLHSDDRKVVDHEITISSSSSSDDCIGGSVAVPPNLPVPLQFFHFLPLKN